jgi:hypothetical protein
MNVTLLGDPSAHFLWHQLIPTPDPWAYPGHAPPRGAVHGFPPFLPPAACIAPVITACSTCAGRLQRKSLDVKDLATYGVYGALLSNIGHMWYRHLHVLTLRSWRLNTWQMIATKLVADMALFNPVHITALLSWTSTTRGRPVRVCPYV